MDIVLLSLKNGSSLEAESLSRSGASTNGLATKGTPKLFVVPFGRVIRFDHVERPSGNQLNPMPKSASSPESLYALQYTCSIYDIFFAISSILFPLFPSQKDTSID